MRTKMKERSKPKFNRGNPSADLSQSTENHLTNCTSCGAKRGTLYQVEGHLVCLDCSPYWDATTPSQVRKASIAAVTNGKKGYGAVSKSKGYVGRKRKLNWTGKSNVVSKSRNADLVP